MGRLVNEYFIAKRIGGLLTTSYFVARVHWDALFTRLDFSWVVVAKFVVADDGLGGSYV